MAYETDQDKARETLIAKKLLAMWPNLQLLATPRFHPTDFHVTGPNGYMGDLEIKWYNKPASEAVVFNYNKWQNLYLLDSVLQRPQAHRIVIRFDDGLLVMPVTALAGRTPTMFTRHDTGERDLVLRIAVGELPDHYWHDVTVKEQ